MNKAEKAARKAWGLSWVGPVAMPPFCFKEDLPMPSGSSGRLESTPTYFLDTVSLDEMVSRVAKGDELALGIVLETLVRVTGNLVEVMRKKPELARRITRKAAKLPVLLGRNEDYFDYARAFLEQMQVGEELPLNIVQRKSGGRPSGKMPATPVVSVALSLMEYINCFRDGVRLKCSMGEGFGITLSDLGLSEWGKSAVGLKDFSASSAPAWAGVSLAALVESFGDDLSTQPRLAAFGVNAGNHYRNSRRGIAARDRAKSRHEGTMTGEYAHRDLLASERADVNARIRSEIRKAFRDLAKPA